MSLPLWVSELATEFWASAGEEEAFPRNLRLPIATTLPLTVVLLPRLRVARIDTWLRRQGIMYGLTAGDRALRACLVARYSQGLVFLDGADPEDQQRFSLAHELAHFLRDYRRPRQVVSDRLGSQVLEVLDGDRPPRSSERVQALLARVSIGFHVHLMERTGDGQMASLAIEGAERDADLLAFELLAPSARVLEEMDRYPHPERADAMTALLIETYGLPAQVAVHYSLLLAPPVRRGPSFMSRLRSVT